jgi:hypothetical protein
MGNVALYNVSCASAPGDCKLRQLLFALSKWYSTHVDLTTRTSALKLQEVVKISIFWDVAPCSIVEVDRRFRGAYCLHHQGDEAGSKHL